MCSYCIDSSDIGNMMFGLGGSGRGYGLASTWAAASFFNTLTGEPFFSPDGKGAIPGHVIGTLRAFNNPGWFCRIVNGARGIGYNDAESLDKVSHCAACTTDSVTGIGNKWHGGTPPHNPSSLRRLSDDGSALEELEQKTLISHLR
jgi:hypothetical protein